MLNSGFLSETRVLTRLPVPLKDIVHFFVRLWFCGSCDIWLYWFFWGLGRSVCACVCAAVFPPVLFCCFCLFFVGLKSLHRSLNTLKSCWKFMDNVTEADMKPHRLDTKDGPHRKNYNRATLGLETSPCSSAHQHLSDALWLDLIDRLILFTFVSWILSKVDSFQVIHTSIYHHSKKHEWKSCCNVVKCDLVKAVMWMKALQYSLWT